MIKKVKFLRKLFSKKNKYDILQIEKECFFMRNVIDVSNYIIKYCVIKGYNITNLRLQKILYYVQGYFLKAYDQPAFPEEIVAWPYGPVVPEAYYNYCSFGRNELCLFENINYDFSSLSSEEKRTINTIVDRCSKLSITDLVDKTHSETPWRETPVRNQIATSEISDFFEANNPLDIGGLYG